MLSRIIHWLFLLIRALVRAKVPACSKIAKIRGTSFFILSLFFFHLLSLSHSETPPPLSPAAAAAAAKSFQNEQREEEEERRKENSHAISSHLTSLHLENFARDDWDFHFKPPKKSKFKTWRPKKEKNRPPPHNQKQNEVNATSWIEKDFALLNFNSKRTTQFWCVTSRPPATFKSFAPIQ